MPGTVWRRPTWPALFVGLLILALLPACSAANPAILTSPEPTTVPVTRLTLWYALPPAEGRLLQSLVDEWSAAGLTPLEIDLEAAPSAEVLHQRLLAAIQSDASPDLAIVRPTDLPEYVSADALAPLVRPVSGERELLHNLFNPVSNTGTSTLYSWPLYRHLVLLVINQARAEELGATLEEPMTWPTLVELCARHREGGGAPCYAAYPDGPVALLWLWSHGGDLTDGAGDGAVLDGAGGEEMMAWLASLRAVDGIVPVPTSGDAREALARGDSLFNFASTAEMQLPDGTGGGTGPWTVTVPEALRGGSTSVATGPDLVAFRSTPEQEAVAAQLFAFLTGPEAGYQWASASGAYPVRRSTLRRLAEEWPPESLVAQGAVWLETARTTPATSHWVELESVLAQATLDTIMGRMTPEEALSEAGRRIQGILAP